MRPRVVIDVALLGWAHQKKSYARGVHRVAEQIVSGLIETNECDLQFVATSSLAGAFRALVEKGSGWEKKLIYRPYQFTLSRWAERIWVWIERTLPDRRLHMRGLRWLMHRFARWADSAAKRIPKAALRDADIYHSPLSPIPRTVRACDNITCFLTVHDLIPLTRPETVGGRGVRVLKRQLDSLTLDSFVFCVSETVRNDLLKQTCLRSDHIFVTPLAADPKIFYTVTDLNKIAAVCFHYGIPHRPYFLVLSSFDPRKNFTHVIECFANLAESGELYDCNLVIVGSNPERSAVVDNAISKYPKLNGRIICPGFIPDGDVAPIYCGALAFLFPSLAEGFGMPPLEAMQCGVPVICSNSTALPEVVGNAAILLPPTDVEAWSAALKSIWEDSGLREEMAKLGLARSHDFSWERFSKTILGGYRSALESRAAAGLHG